MPLPVLQADPLEAALRPLVKGQVRFSRHDRLLYSTDASLYQVEPLGVVVPADADDVGAVMRFCDERKVALLPRGGGTSLAGQGTNRAIVLDLSAMQRRMLNLDAARRECVVEPGISVDELNRQLKASSLFFAPDPATSAQCAIGGCIGNNAAGARSIAYGRTSENVAGLELTLVSGERVWLESGAGSRNVAALRLADAVAKIVRDHAPLIRERFPRTIRRNAGYGLDLILKQLDAGTTHENLDLSGLICGSEGTLGVVTQARLKLHPVPKARGLALVSFPTLEAAIDSVVAILSTRPSAVELLDEVVLGAAQGNNECRAYLELVAPIAGRPPAALLYVEYQAIESIDEITSSFDALKRVVGTDAIRCYTDPTQMGRAWALRKAGEPLLHGLAGDRKPQTFVEDNAVPVENLSRFVREFKKIVQKHGTTAAYYAHASVGVLHIRPLVNMHSADDRVMLQNIAVEVADLARECGGVMSGEHGDGRVRGPLLERFYGPELMDAFRSVKRIFDPNGILNPGMITDPGTVQTITQNLRSDHVDAGVDPDSIRTYYNYDDQHGFRGAVEMCNGAGVCRKTAVGTMCPSYRGTLDERHATRGRGNALRLAISGQFGNGSNGPDWNDPETLQTLDLCLSCKACKSECPSNVDIARLKAEYLAQSYKASGKTPLKARVFGHVRTLNRLGSIMPGVSNFVGSLEFVRSIMNRVLKLAPQRTLPKYERSLYSWFASRNLAGTRPVPKVVLYADCFATYNEPHIGKAAVSVLETLGYDVLLPRVGCCGRAMMSTGVLADACRSADRTLADLKTYIDDDSVKAIVVCEPSCLASFKDDWLTLNIATPIATRKKLAAKSWLVEEFVDRFWDAHPKKPSIKKLTEPVVLHGHCHQKALWGDQTSSGLLKRIAEQVTVLPSGCCGMAGSFGYDASKYELSMKIGELSVFPPVREAGNDAVICAPGTSCRHQIHDGTKRHAIHPIELAARVLG
jgi:FAD/FMN-containing dehydrogenase/Fe-S oxidoreductase